MLIAFSKLGILLLIHYYHSRITRAHSFPRAAEFQAKPQNLTFSAECSHFHGISRTFAEV